MDAHVQAVYWQSASQLRNSESGGHVSIYSLFGYTPTREFWFREIDRRLVFVLNDDDDGEHVPLSSVIR